MSSCLTTNSKSVKCHEELHQEYLYIFGDKDDCHFRDFLHLTGNFELMPMVEMLNEKGVSMYHPRSYFSFNKEQLLAGCPNDEGKMSYSNGRNVANVFCR